jgi:prepilin signal peptidase PulO-like enzyme (type II secretory pathway)
VFFLLVGLDFYDLAIICCSAAFGLTASYQDLRSNSFSLWLGCSIAAMGILWCVKQKFFPISIVPIVCGLFIILIVQQLFKITKKYLRKQNSADKTVVESWLAGGDMFLLCTACFFVTPNELPAFLIFCGIGGILTFLLQKKICGKKNKTLPFVPSIVAAQWITFFLYSLGV